VGDGAKGPQVLNPHPNPFTDQQDPTTYFRFFENKLRGKVSFPQGSGNHLSQHQQIEPLVKES
jgi:hypothetical protein